MNTILFMYFSKMTRNSSRWLIALIAVGFSIAFLAIFCSGFGRHLNFFVDHQQNFALSHLHRKLLGLEMEPNRAFADKCSTSDIVVSQGPTAPLPNGIPTYTVEIMNVCASGCNISGIHLSCGWFSSARLINPTVFKRIAYDDCLVNGGNALANGDALSFQYANSFSYPLSVSSVRC